MSVRPFFGKAKPKLEPQAASLREAAEQDCAAIGMIEDDPLRVVHVRNAARFDERLQQLPPPLSEDQQFAALRAGTEAAIRARLKYARLHIMFAASAAFTLIAIGLGFWAGTTWHGNQTPEQWQAIMAYNRLTDVLTCTNHAEMMAAERAKKARPQCQTALWLEPHG